MNQLWALADLTPPAPDLQPPPSSNNGSLRPPSSYGRLQDASPLPPTHLSWDRSGFQQV